VATAAQTSVKKQYTDSFIDPVLERIKFYFKCLQASDGEIKIGGLIIRVKDNKFFASDVTPCIELKGCFRFFANDKGLYKWQADSLFLSRNNFSVVIDNITFIFRYSVEEWNTQIYYDLFPVRRLRRNGSLIHITPFNGRCEIFSSLRKDYEGSFQEGVFSEVTAETIRDISRVAFGSGSSGLLEDLIKIILA